MAKQAQLESGEGRVTAKSRPMMNLTARTPSFVSSSASSNPGRTSHGYQDPERFVNSNFFIVNISVTADGSLLSPTVV